MGTPSKSDSNDVESIERLAASIEKLTEVLDNRLNQIFLILKETGRAKLREPKEQLKPKPVRGMR